MLETALNVTRALTNWKFVRYCEIMTDDVIAKMQYGAQKTRFSESMMNAYKNDAVVMLIAALRLPSTGHSAGPCPRLPPTLCWIGRWPEHFVCELKTDGMLMEDQQENSLWSEQSFWRGWRLMILSERELNIHARIGCGSCSQPVSPVDLSLGTVSHADVRFTHIGFSLILPSSFAFFRKRSCVLFSLKFTEPSDPLLKKSWKKFQICLKNPGGFWGCSGSNCTSGRVAAKSTFQLGDAIIFLFLTSCSSVFVKAHSEAWRVLHLHRHVHWCSSPSFHIAYNISSSDIKTKDVNL